MKKGLLVVMIVLCVSVAYAADSNVSACGTISSSGTHTLNQSITSSTDCITIDTDDVIIDCAGHTITYNTGGGSTDWGVGTVITPQTNISVQNCNITDGSAGGAQSFSVYFYAITNGSIVNNTIYADGGSAAFGIYLREPITGINVSGNTISSIGSTSNMGVRFNSQANSNHFTNNVVNAQGSDGVMYGLYFGSHSWNNIVENNTITATATGAVAQIYGFTISTNNSHNVFRNNAVSVRGSPSSAAEGIRTTSSSTGTNYNNVTDNEIYMNTSTGLGRGIFILHGNENRVERNVITSIGTVFPYGIIVHNTTNATIRDNIISPGASSPAGILIQGSSYDLTFDGNVLNSLSTWLSSSTSNATFTNLTLNTSDGSIKFAGPAVVSGTFSLNSTTTDITNNSAFHNSSAAPEFNTSARITVRNLGLVYYQALVDYEDEGTFVNCNPPQCVVVSSSPAEFMFDVLSFTTYSATDGTPPVPEFSTIALMAALGLILGGFVVMRRK
jgi:hypothetical protein